MNFDETPLSQEELDFLARMDSIQTSTALTTDVGFSDDDVSSQLDIIRKMDDNFCSSTDLYSTYIYTLNYYNIQNGVYLGTKTYSFAKKSGEKFVKIYGIDNVNPHKAVESVCPTEVDYRLYKGKALTQMMDISIEVDQYDTTITCVKDIQKIMDTDPNLNTNAAPISDEDLMELFSGEIVFGDFGFSPGRNVVKEEEDYLKTAYNSPNTLIVESYSVI